tara:strand:- start:166910 stop:167176 length:267 start_codon:yes stop_codon:yes gene_type:complete
MHADMAGFVSPEVERTPPCRVIARGQIYNMAQDIILTVENKIIILNLTLKLKVVNLFMLALKKLMNMEDIATVFIISKTTGLVLQTNL